jgi:hypothetical protein
VVAKDALQGDVIPVLPGGNRPKVFGPEKIKRQIVILLKEESNDNCFFARKRLHISSRISGRTHATVIEKRTFYRSEIIEKSVELSRNEIE